MSTLLVPFILEKNSGVDNLQILLLTGGNATGATDQVYVIIQGNLEFESL